LAIRPQSTQVNPAGDVKLRFYFFWGVGDILQAIAWEGFVWQEDRIPPL
jgi:hypothetical protein